jgi:hypothetical protein
MLDVETIKGDVYQYATLPGAVGDRCAFPQIMSRRLGEVMDMWIYVCMNINSRQMVLQAVQIYL